ncbi:MAG: hypothetical protein LUB61_04305 [Eggerthellaceae bacterium]|nr:hypothetical protein [Eggerthellaceae bacterium]
MAEEELNDFVDDEDFYYDPLEEEDLYIDTEDDAEVYNGQLGPQINSGSSGFVVKEDTRTPQERISDLFSSLSTRRRILLQILAYLDNPVRNDALNEKVDEFQEYDHAVYSGYDYAIMLERAGAISRVSEDGGPFDEEAEQLPDIVEIDGSKFYKPTDGKQIFWLITQDGQDYLEEDDPKGRFMDLMESDSKYKSLYHDVLDFCNIENGRITSELDDFVKDSPLSHNPFRHFSYFAKKLEDCGLMSWQGTWGVTDLGRQMLESYDWDTKEEDSVHLETEENANE